MYDQLDLEKLRDLRERMETLRPLAVDPNLGRDAVQAAAARLDLSERHVRRCVTDLRNNPIADSVDPARQQGRPRQPRLPRQTRIILYAKIQSFLLGTAEWKSRKALHAEIEAACLDTNTLVPSLSTVRRKVAELSKICKARARQIKGEVRDYKPTPHHHDVAWPLDEVQIDHTLMDLIVDLEEFGLGLKRIWLTLAIDVASRMIYGFHLGLKAPTARTVGLTVMMGMLPKRPVVEASGVSWEEVVEAIEVDPWPIFGVPQVIATDNGKDFRSRAAQMAYVQFGIRASYRPVGAPHYGGHIERLIGTFMKAVHELPGTTSSSPKCRGSYDSAGKAFLTLEDVEQWLVAKILEYHLTPHKGLDGITPLQKFQHLEAQRPHRFPMIPDEVDIRTAFLPTENRMVGKQGIRFANRYYYHPGLAELVGRRVAVKYHPARINQLYVCLNGLKPTFEALPIRNAGRCRYLEALVDRLPTAAMAAETKRQAAVARRLMVQRNALVERARGHRLRRTPAKALATPQVSLRTQAGRPAPSQPAPSTRLRNRG
ncbi:Mu transposase C-terminal domain-containing protein [Gimibacter soli]|uniref:Mu transposase C-terminal domain-containing protein n=1 Tax=Gimibacter soli TaxID=3024400 RepID=A0AAF0BN85_9PROT|nr:Mu transposase C-terminal domain-containing protein [Gimibacter soli]WCL55606.1 Mu transposase C-terminal domain-containing protein [Gimibacter soli]